MWVMKNGMSMGRTKKLHQPDSSVFGKSLSSLELKHDHILRVQVAVDPSV
jgi:hypothetical protein